MPIIGQISVGDGATFTPAVDNDGVISWSNNKNLPNPASVDIPQAVINRYQLAPTSNPTFTGMVTAEDVTASGDVGVGGDLSVTGAITGNLTGNADTATNATNDGNGNQIDTTYLPLSGGTMTGTLVSTQIIALRQNGEDSSLQLYGGTDGTSSRLILFGKANSVYPGAFSLEARDGSNAAVLYGAPSGTLIWGGNSIAIANKTFQLSDDFATEFTNGANLNNYTTAGTYISSSASITGSLLNCPVSGVGFKMIVIYAGYSSIAYGGTQIIFANTGIFARRNGGSATSVSWSAWKTVVSY